jgi:GTP-binding protein Era
MILENKKNFNNNICKAEKKCGFVAIVGPTNAGKSTLMNAILCKHASIVSHKVQTTRNQIRAIKNFDNTQLVFIDTPGIFDAKNRFDKAMVKSAMDSVFDCDAVLVIIDAAKGVSKNILRILDFLKGGEAKKSNANMKIFAVLNKIDLINKLHLLELANVLNGAINFDKIFMISAIKNDGINDIISSVIEAVPVSHWFYENDTIDIPDALYYAEITREQVYKFLHKELPYDISVLTDSIVNSADGVLEISQTIYVSRVSQRKIVIGDNANVIKIIGMRSRKNLQEIIGRKVRLFLHAKVQENWRDKKEFYDEIGLEFNS